MKISLYIFVLLTHLIPLYFHAEFDQMLYDNGDDNFNKPLVISLGYNCTVANMLRKYEIRQFASPFDWMYSSLHGVCKCIEERFKDFMNPDYLIVDNTAVLNTKYTFAFFHDFPTERGKDYPANNWRDALEEITMKYTRRIERFCKIMDSGRPVYLIRSYSIWPKDPVNQTPDEIKYLRDILLRTFPNSNFTIIAISTEVNYTKNWNLPGIYNFRFNNVMSDEDWKLMLQEMRLLQ